MKFKDFKELAELSAENNKSKDRQKTNFLPERYQKRLEEKLKKIKFADSNLSKGELNEAFSLLQGIIPYFKEGEIKNFIAEREKILQAVKKEKRKNSEHKLAERLANRIIEIRTTLEKLEEKYRKLFKKRVLEDFENRLSILGERKILKENLNQGARRKYFFKEKKPGAEDYYVFSRPRLKGYSYKKLKEIFSDLEEAGIFGEQVEEQKKEYQRRRNRRREPEYYNWQTERSNEREFKCRIQKIVEKAKKIEVEVKFLDENQRLCEETWPLIEYLWRMGVEHKAADEERVAVNVLAEGDLGHFGITDFFSKIAFLLAKERRESKEKIKNEKSLNKRQKKKKISFEKLIFRWQREVIKNRIKEGYEYDDKLVKERSYESRVRQIDSQYKEDPLFASFVENAGYLFTKSLPLHCDYFDKVDVLVGIDLEELSGDKKKKSKFIERERPVYLGVQRTVATEKNIIDRKLKDIRKNPFAFIPEYPEKNPIFVFVFPEKKDDYYLKDKKGDGRSVSRWEILREINEQRAQRGERGFRVDKAFAGDTEKELREKLSRPLDGETKKKIAKKMIEKNIKLLETAIKELTIFLKNLEARGREGGYYYKLASIYRNQAEEAKRIIEEDNEEILKGNNNK